MKRLKHIIFLISSLLFTQISFGQIYPHPGSTAIVAADILNVRSMPGISEAIQGKITLGQEVLITASSDSFFTSNGRSYPFVEIIYQAEGEEARGFVWAGLLTQAYAYSGNALYLLKHIKGGDETDYLATFTLIKREEGTHEQLAELENIPLELTFLGAINLKVSPVEGLENIERRVQVTMITDACCSSINEYNFLEMKTTAAIALPPVGNVLCDGFQPEQTYYFPNDPVGKESKIILAETGYDQEGNIAYVETIDSFDWNGKDISVYRK